MNQDRIIIASDKFVEDYLFHTSNIMNAFEMYNIHKKININFNKYLDDKLVYFYYGKHLGYISDVNVESIYFPIVLGCHKDVLTNIDCNIYPFDSGGVINRLRYCLSEISEFKYSSLSKINTYLMKVYKNYDNYDAGVHSINTKPKELKKLLNGVDDYLNDGLVDKRIKYFEVSFKRSIEIKKVTKIILPRQYFNLSELKPAISMILNNIPEVFYQTKSFNESNSETKIIAEMFELSPYLLTSFKESLKVIHNDVISYNEKDNEIIFIPKYLVNNLDKLSGFCSILGEEEINSSNYFEICTSRDNKKIFKLMINKNNFERYVNISDIAYRDNKSIEHPKKYVHQINKYNINLKLLFNNSEFWTYKFNNQTIVFGSRDLIMQISVSGIGTINNYAHTYSELVAFIKEGNLKNENIVKAKEYVEKSLYFYSLLLNGDTELMENILVKYTDLRMFETDKIRSDLPIRLGAIMINDNFYYINEDNISDYIEYILIRGKVIEEIRKKIMIDNRYISSSTFSQILNGRMKKCEDFLRMLNELN